MDNIDEEQTDQEQYLNIHLNTKKILYYILLSGGVIALSVLAPKLPYEILKAYLKNKKFNVTKFNRDIKKLSDRGDIRINKNSVSITKKGKTRVLKYKLDEIEIKPQEKWDQLWRLVVFDVPNEYKKSADTLRDKLKNFGFLPYQKSIFIIPYPCRDEIDFIKEIFEVGAYVHLITAIEIEDEEYFIGRFKLSKKFK